MIQELRNTHSAESLNFNLLLKKILFFPRCLCTLGGKFLPKLSIKCEQPQPRASTCLSIFKSILQTVQRGNVITYLLYRFTFNRNYFLENGLEYVIIPPTAVKFGSFFQRLLAPLSWRGTRAKSGLRSLMLLQRI